MTVALASKARRWVHRLRSAPTAAGPHIIVTLGLFSLVVSASMLLVTGSLMETFDVDGFGAACIGAIVIAVVTLILDAVLLREPHHAAS